MVRSCFRCMAGDCTRIFTSVGGLRQHMINKHPEMVTRRKGERAIDHLRKTSRLCDICLELFNSPQALKHHKNMAHTEPTDYPCTSCDKVFSQKRYLTEHARSHQQKHKCLYCSKVYGQKKTMMRHMREAHNWTG